MVYADHLLRTFAGVAPAARVLDAACREGQQLVPLALLGFDLQAVDRDCGKVQQVQALLETEGLPEVARRVQVGDPARLPFADAHFDWVLACGLLDGYSDAERLALLTELRRVLAPGGWLYASWQGTPGALTRLFERADFAVAEKAAFDGQMNATRGIFRRVEADTVG